MSRPSAKPAKITKEQGDAAFKLYKTTPYSVRTVAVQMGLDVDALEGYAKRAKWGTLKVAARDRDISLVEREFAARRRQVVNDARDYVSAITTQSMHTLAELAEEAAGRRDVKSLREVNQTIRETWQLACEVLDIRPDMRENRVELIHRWVPDFLKGDAEPDEDDGG